MNKELTPLEALEKLWQGAINPYEYLLDDEPNNIVLKETIEKSLKALEIIKENIFVSYDESENDKPCLVLGSKTTEGEIIIFYVTYDKEKIGLLKEVLLCGSQKQMLMNY